MFVDSGGRRSKVLRRIGLLVGVVCLAYAGVLGAAFMGWGTSLAPSSLLPFGDARDGRGPGIRPQGGIGRRADLPSSIPSPSASASTSLSVSSSPSPPAVVSSSAAGRPRCSARASSSPCCSCWR